MRNLVLIRGLPGSGKSTFARQALEDLSHMNPVHWETDMFFETDEGYVFDPKRLGEAHQWCQDHVRASLVNSKCVIVANTFSRVWEMQPYIDMAAEFKAHLLVAKLNTDFGNIHNVPESTIERMRDRWEDYPGEIVLD
jgi:predicted kinase